MIDGSLRQMMVAARELNVERLPESGRNWINDEADLHARLRRDHEPRERLHAKKDCRRSF